MRLSAITVYPVKSLRGVHLDEAEVQSRGFRHDRRWMLVDGDGRFVSQREEARLCLVDVALEEGGYELRVDGKTVRIPESHEGDRMAVKVWSSTVDAVAHAEGSRFFSEWLGREVRLVCLPSDVVRETSRGNGEVSFADGYPYLLISEASLRDLNERINGAALSLDRFRPNLVVEGAEAYAEDAWEQLRIGEVGFRGVKRCDRCVMTTIDPSTAEKGKEPLRTLATYRREDGKVWFGMNLCPDAEGLLRVGDAVTPA